MVTDRQLRQCSDSDSDSSPTVRQRDVRQWSDSGPTVVRQWSDSSDSSDSQGSDMYMCIHIIILYSYCTPRTPHIRVTAP